MDLQHQHALMLHLAKTPENFSDCLAVQILLALKFGFKVCGWLFGLGLCRLLTYLFVAHN
jgi:hypothetical protein